ncbi:MAG: hypothetical protein H7259_06820 [Cytophagales bacterium]|nr:hypothetical protein [Cytophaga sp.]
MKIYVFASLKDFMPAEIELSKEMLHDVDSVKEVLKKTYPSASTLLEACRFSTDRELVSLGQNITSYENLYVIPPSSGG